MQLTPRAVLAHRPPSSDRRVPSGERPGGHADARLESLVSILALVPLGKFVSFSRGRVGHPSCERQNLASAFVAKAVLNLIHTPQLIDRLRLTAASVHDSQVAIPLATMTASRVTSLYDLMDST